MSREAHIPLVLWISAAIVVHMAGGGGAVEAARFVEERDQFRAMIHAVRDSFRADTTFEILVDAPSTPPSNTPPPPEVAPDDASKAKAEKDLAKLDPSAKPKKEKPKPPKLLPPKPAAKVAVKPPPPKKEAPPPPKKEIAKVEPTKPAPVVVAPPPPPPPPAEKRLAVKQNVKKDQEDNATAKRIADDANHTEQETMARIRAHDQDAPEPAGGAGGTAKGEPGNSDHNKTAQSEEKPGNPEHAPGEAKPSSTSVDHNSPAPATASRAPAPTMPGSQALGGGNPAAPRPSEASPGAPGGAGPASPEVHAANSGGWRIDPANPGGDGKSRFAGPQRAATPYQPPVSVGALGFGAPGIPGGPNLNLTMGGLEAAVGQDQLKRERAADGAARKTAHRGSSDPNKFQKMRAAIENYDPSVKLGNQTSLNAARVPFATFINAIHNRIHPIFAEEFLAALENLPPSHTLNQELVTHVEIVLSKDEGRIVRLGVTKASGSTAFDTVAVSSVQRASPFGKAPDEIVSPDGNIYIHWEFHRDPFDACTTRNARPYLLKAAPTPVTPAPSPPKRPTLSPTSDDRGSGPAPILPLR